MPVPRLKSLDATAKGAWHEYGGWIILFGFAYLMWTFRKVFSTAGDTAADSIAAVTVGVQTKAKAVADTAKVKAAAPNIKKAPTQAQLDKWRADARTLAAYLGTAPGWTAEDLVPNQMDAFHLLKTEYSRLALFENQPIHRVNGKTVKQTVETSDSVKNPVYWTVLAPFYKEETEGRDLRADLNKYLGDYRFRKYLKWVI